MIKVPIRISIMLPEEHGAIGLLPLEERPAGCLPRGPRDGLGGVSEQASPFLHSYNYYRPQP